MCAGPVKNLYEDVTGITAQKKAASIAAANAAKANEMQAIIDANKQSTLTIGAEADAANQATAAAAANAISNYQQQAQAQIVLGSSGPSAADVAARNASISAAQTSQGIISKQGKKKKKGLKISPKDAYAKGTGSPGSTSASLKIGSQGSSPGTGTNLPV